MNRRAMLGRVGAWMVGAAASGPVLAQQAQRQFSTVRDALGWVAVIGRHGETVIRISPRFIVEHPREAISLMTTGRLP